MLFCFICSLINADFAAAAVLITFGAMLGRVSPVQLLMIAFVECICFSGNNALNLYIFGAADVGGSMLIHTFGAYFGLAASVALYRKAAKNHPRNSNSYHSDLFAMIGEFVFPCSKRVCVCINCILRCVAKEFQLHGK